MRALARVLVALSALSALGTFGSFFAAVWSHGRDLPERWMGTGFLLALVAGLLLACSISVMDAAQKGGKR